MRLTRCSSCQADFVEEHIGESLCVTCLHSLVSFRNTRMKDHFFGDAPAPFIGRYGYPYVNVGVLSPGVSEENSWQYDSPRHWVESNASIPEIVRLRSALVNSRTKSNVRDQEKVAEVAQDVAMASKPVELEISLKKVPKFGVYWEKYSAPMGPAAELTSIDITSNPKIHTKVDKVFSDIDLKAAEGLAYLYHSGFEPYNLSRMLSVGTMGIGKNRKLVPTRWSITATDDTIGKQLIKEVKDFPESDYMAFTGDYFGNYYVIMLFPEKWSYELFETYSAPEKQDQLWTDHEFYSGRKSYAADTVGGYYAARLSILEKLHSMKRQASVLALRFVTDEYSVPLGVWVVREAAKKAMQNKPIRFASRKLMLKFAETYAKKKLGYNAQSLFGRSHLLKQIIQQKKLFEYA